MVRLKKISRPRKRETLTIKQNGSDNTKLASNKHTLNYMFTFFLRPTKIFTTSTRRTSQWLTLIIWGFTISEKTWAFTPLIPQTKEQKAPRSWIKSKNFQMSYCLFLCIRWWSCNDQAAKKTRRPIPTTDQKITNQRGIGLGYNPVRLVIKNALEACTINQ